MESRPRPWAGGEYSGSRFRRAGRTPGVFYASETCDIAVAEIVFYRSRPAREAYWMVSIWSGLAERYQSVSLAASSRRHWRRAARRDRPVDPVGRHQQSPSTGLARSAADAAPGPACTPGTMVMRVMGMSPFESDVPRRAPRDDHRSSGSTVERASEPFDRELRGPVPGRLPAGAGAHLLDDARVEDDEAAPAVSRISRQPGARPC